MMQKDSLSVEDLNFGLSNLMNNILDKNVLEDRGKLLSSRADNCGITFDKSKHRSHGKMAINREDRLHSEREVLTKDTIENPHSLIEKEYDRNGMLFQNSEKQKQNAKTAETEFSAKTPTFLKRISAGRTNKSQQYCAEQTENNYWLLRKKESDVNCPKLQTEVNPKAESTEGSMKKKSHLWKQAKGNTAPVTTTTDLPTLTKAVKAIHSGSYPKKLLSTDQFSANQVCSSRKNFPQSRRFSVPFSVRHLPSRSRTYKRISSTHEEIGQENAEENNYPSRSKLFSPTPPRNEERKPQLDESKFSTLTNTNAFGQKLSGQKLEQQQNILTAESESLRHKAFEPTLIANRFLHSSSKRELRRKSYEANSSDTKLLSDTTTHVSSTVSPRTTNNSKLLPLVPPLLSGRRRSESSVHQFVNFDSPIFESDIGENLTPLAFSSQATKKDNIKI